jgi:anti-sigma B factor antagonist
VVVRRPVVVMELPEQIGTSQVPEILEDVSTLLEFQRPRIVFDCSEVRSIDSAGVEMLMYCLDEAMKRDGDLKLAAMSPQAKMILEIMRVDGIFEIFETAGEAVRSFNVPTLAAIPEDAFLYASAPEEWEHLRRAS